MSRNQSVSSFLNRSSFVIGAIVLATPLALFAAPAQALPTTMMWSATVENDEGPYQGDVSLTLSLFDAATGGTRVFQESVAQVSVNDGVLTHELGTNPDAPLDADVWGNESLYLEVTINNTVLEPRLPIRAVPYALHAQDAIHAQEADLAQECLSLEGLSADDVSTDAEVNARFAALTVPFSAITDVPAGLADGELVVASNSGLNIDGNNISIADGGVTAARLASNAVDGGKIVDGSVRAADVTGVQIFRQHGSCSDSGSLTTASSCPSRECLSFNGNSTYYQCIALGVPLCNAPAPITCNNSVLGKLVN